MSAPCAADDIKVNKCPREDYPTHRGAQIVGTDSTASRPRVLQRTTACMPVVR